ncbi:hypothetical protein SeGA_4797 [Salmonella enterica subsp. enterica serovar Gaminara str. A4-567]|nr:hypothetical protein SeGA_4797 [Salmonella enterica subsp. enterica serovar Gaminara str. A4-567]
MTLQLISAEEIIQFHDRLLRVTPGVTGMPDPVTPGVTGMPACLILAARKR